MSSIYTPRIKQIRKRSGGEFATGIPLGTDGILVDMVSELDLEEELRLGGNHYVDIIKTDTATQIKEWYFTEPRGSRTLTEMSQFVTFSASVSIISAIDTPLGQTVEDGSFITDQESENLIVIREAISLDEQRIIMSLYRGDLDNNGILIHQKTVYINKAENGQIAIDEQVDYDGVVNNLLQQEEQP